MAQNCCDAKSDEIDKLKQSQIHVLKIVFLVNLIMFFIEIVSGYISSSSSLMADSLDMLGDALVYAFSLYVINKGIIWKAKAGLYKGYLMFGISLFIIGELIYKLVSNRVPEYEVMTIVGVMALLANLVCVILLYKHKTDDINLRSTWICSRNDIISNTAVIFASYLVKLTNTIWPDVIVALVISYLFLTSSIGVVKEAKLELNKISLK